MHVTLEFTGQNFLQRDRADDEEKNADCQKSRSHAHSQQLQGGRLRLLRLHKFLQRTSVVRNTQGYALQCIQPLSRATETARALPLQRFIQALQQCYIIAAQKVLILRQQLAGRSFWQGIVVDIQVRGRCTAHEDFVYRCRQRIQIRPRADVPAFFLALLVRHIARCAHIRAAEIDKLGYGLHIVC